MDLLMSHQAGFTNTVASSGTALTESHLNIIRRLSNKIIIAYDADLAGAGAAARRLGKIALACGMEVKSRHFASRQRSSRAYFGKSERVWKRRSQGSAHY